MLKSSASEKGAHRSGKVNLVEEEESEGAMEEPLELGSLAPDLTPREGMTTGKRLRAVNWDRSPVEAELSSGSPAPEPTWTVARRLQAVNWGRQATRQRPVEPDDSVDSQNDMTVDSFFSNANW